LVKLSERDRPYRGGASDVVAVANEQEPLGVWIELVARTEEIQPSGVGKPLACYHNGDVIIGIEIGQGGVWGISGDNAIVGREPATKVSLHGSEDVAVVVDGHQHWLRHAAYSIPGVCAVPFGPGVGMSVSSV
jgi:hypothetical protein